jgi:predicted O-methyltransferase YrrM
VKLLLRYLLFYFRSGNAHSIHSPFVFDLYTKVIRSAQAQPVFTRIENIRRQLLGSKEVIEIRDLGAGSRISNSPRRRIETIARYAEKNSCIGQLLYRLVDHFGSETVLDLGTSLGVTTLYLASPHRQCRVFTFEGCPETLKVAKRNFSALDLDNIQAVEGNIDQTLPKVLERLGRVDFAFFDANHRLEPTLRYFRTCLGKAHEDSVFVFDDIYWSLEMMQAWQEIKNHSSVTLTVDLFHIGIVFFRRKQPKQHFALRM